LTGAACENNCGTDGTPGSCKTVVIGTQTWMAENLNRETANSWCYENSTESCKKYGRLYTWAAARTACPNRWHLPTRDEWRTLAKAAGATDAHSEGDGSGGTAGTKLKSTSGWYGNENGTDDFGFSALPGGYRYDAKFNAAGDIGAWWTATNGGVIGGNENDYAYYRVMNNYRFGEAVSEDVAFNSNGYSVRCVQ